MLVHHEQSPTRPAAMKREKWLKPGVGRAWLDTTVGKARPGATSPDIQSPTHCRCRSSAAAGKIISRLFDQALDIFIRYAILYRPPRSRAARPNAGEERSIFPDSSIGRASGC